MTSMTTSSSMRVNPARGRARAEARRQEGRGKREERGAEREEGRAKSEERGAEEREAESGKRGEERELRL
jgi:hypothetical protein